VDLLGPCGAFTEPCRPLMFPLSLAGTPEPDSDSVRCAGLRKPDLAVVKKKDFDLRARGLCFDPPVRASRAKAQEHLPSCREAASFYTCSPPVKATFSITSPARTVSPSTHPRPASGGATNFLPASALSHQSALQPLGEEDARCVQPTSATQSNCVHPHLVCSQLALATFAAGRPRGV
jgi:hypothetical protein